MQKVLSSMKRCIRFFDWLYVFPNTRDASVAFEAFQKFKAAEEVYLKAKAEFEETLVSLGVSYEKETPLD